jgi:hypothetical protein
MREIDEALIKPLDKNPPSFEPADNFHEDLHLTWKTSVPVWTSPSEVLVSPDIPSLFIKGSLQLDDTACQGVNGGQFPAGLFEREMSGMNVVRHTQECSEFRRNLHGVNFSGDDAEARGERVNPGNPATRV